MSFGIIILFGVQAKARLPVLLVFDAVGPYAL